MGTHTVSHADTLYSGNARITPSATTNRVAAPANRRGIERKNVYWAEIGTCSAAATEGYCTSAGLSATATTGLVSVCSSGALYATTPYIGYTHTRPCAVKLWGGTATVSATFGFEVRGRDEDNKVVIDHVCSTGFASGVTGWGQKSFQYVTGINTISGTDSNVTGKFNFGESDKFGSPVRISDKGKVLSPLMNGAPPVSTGVATGFVLVTVTPGTATQTATSNDIRGTVQFNKASTGGKYTFGVICSTSDKTALYGVANNSATS
ncbi:MAG: hypothetical protein GY841_16155 [FCB group bacterium]|nr:hypothetical protein [FCB group bacterium]